MKFAMLYSCGKDSALALYRMISEGHEPVCLITTYNEEANRSWFHGIQTSLLNAVSKSLRIPLLTCRCTGDTYQAKVEEALSQAKGQGAEAAVFGDIDIQDHLDWNQERCDAAGLTCVVPLWQQQREALVNESIKAGFKALIKCVDLSSLDKTFLGEILDEKTIARIAAKGADVCGENGEYHTFVFDGPIFNDPVPIVVGEIFDFETHAVIDITLAGEQE